jgi:type IV pilus assembly protein PilY1
MAHDTNGFKETCTLEKKLYDFQDLGGTAGLSASQIRIGLEPVYVVFAVSNMSQGRSGLEVHAIEASTGQLMWQWERPYDDSDRLHDNAVPPVATVITGADGAARVFVGDHEGRLWELDAATGKNLNTAATVDCKPEAPCQFPAFDTRSSKIDPQPITTNIAVARIPPDLPKEAPLYPYRGERVALFGTAGADWLSAADQVFGRVHVALLESNRRVPVATGLGLQLDGKTQWTPDSARGVGKTSGVLQEAPAPDFPVQFAKGERVYGAITVAGSVAYFTTATDKVASDVMQLPETGNGHTYTLNLGTAKTNALAGTDAAYGGVAVYLDGNVFKGVVTSQMSTMNYTSTTIPADDAKASNKDSRLKVGDDQGLTYRLMAWLRRVLLP